MKISNFSVKQLTVLASIFMAATFVICYLTFRYFFTYDLAVERALNQQQEEALRVKTLIKIQKNDLAKNLMDYASWDEVTQYIAGENDDFLQDSLNDHSFSSLEVQGVFIFDHNVSLVSGRLYDYINRKELSYDPIRYKFGALLADSLRSPTDKVTSFIKFLVLNDQLYIMGTARVCNSEGVHCDKGFMMMIKPVGQEFIRTLRQATGLEVEIKTSEEFESVDHFAENVSVIEKLDYQNESTVFVVVHHSAKIPDFITWRELSAVLAFAVFMFGFNLYLAHIIIKPVKRARSALDSLISGNASRLTEQDSFISYEMRDFVYRINEVFNQLEAKQKELEWVALHDALTKVGNRRSLQQYWDTMVKHSGSRHISLLLIDIDYFKPFNDHYGHIEGDSVLQQVASCLDQAPTQCDKFVARFGGEEFCVVLSSESKIENQQEAEWLRAAIVELQISHQYSPIADCITVSIGVADCALQPLDELQDIFLVADPALYQAKDLGRNQFVVRSL
ncbi:diguanylate cyclase [Vibrio xuii]|nr:diguanylate cyclase [Vibrio xuii]